MLMFLVVSMAMWRSKSIYLSHTLYVMEDAIKPPCRDQVKINAISRWAGLGI